MPTWQECEPVLALGHAVYNFQFHCTGGGGGISDCIKGLSQLYSLCYTTISTWRVNSTQHLNSNTEYILRPSSVVFCTVIS